MTRQLRTLLTLETPVPKEKLRSVLAYGGYPLSAEDVVDGVTKSWRPRAVPSIVKPAVTHPGLERNALGLTIRDYEGGMSTLCAGCGHNSVTAAITHALWESDTPPHMIAKLSGIGFPAKTLRTSRGAPTGSTDATDACRRSRPARARPIGTCSASASPATATRCRSVWGHLAHLVRRNVRMVYVIENNGVYGLTKGQFSASADVGSTTKRGEANHLQPIDPIFLGLSVGATCLARGFSGDKAPAGADLPRSDARTAVSPSST